MIDCILSKRARFLSRKAGSDWKWLICQRALEEATLFYSLACLNQHNLLCLGVVSRPCGGHLFTVVNFAITVNCVYSIRCALWSSWLGTVEDSTSSGDIYHRRVRDSEHLRHRCERDSRPWPVALGAMLSDISIYSSHPIQTPHSIAPEGLVAWQLQSLDGFVGTNQRAWLWFGRHPVMDFWFPIGPNWGHYTISTLGHDRYRSALDARCGRFVGFRLMITYFVALLA